MTVDDERAQALLQVMRGAGSVSAAARVTSLEQLQGGFSRQTYVADVHDPEQPGGERGFVVRVHAEGSVVDTDLEQEFRTYQALEDEPVPTPGVHGFRPEKDPAFGGPFFVMDRLPGDAVNVWRRRDRAALTADWEGARGLAEDFVQHLAAIHLVAPDRVSAFIAPRSFAETVALWRTRWEEIRLLRDPVVEEAYAWVLDREPVPVTPRLVHSDYRVGNCLIADGRITGVLDWELAHLGDPRFDLAYMSLDYHGGKFTAPGSPLLGGVADREWFFERYAQLTGEEVDREVVRTFAVVGALMLYALLSTGVHAYATGVSTDIRQAWGRFTLPGLRQDLVGLMGWRRTDWR